MILGRFALVATGVLAVTSSSSWPRELQESAFIALKHHYCQNNVIIRAISKQPFVCWLETSFFAMQLPVIAFKKNLVLFKFRYLTIDLTYFKKSRFTHKLKIAVLVVSICSIISKLFDLLPNQNYMIDLIEAYRRSRLFRQYGLFIILDLDKYRLN